METGAGQSVVSGETIDDEPELVPDEAETLNKTGKNSSSQSTDSMFSRMMTMFNAMFAAMMAIFGGSTDSISRSGEVSATGAADSAKEETKPADIEFDRSEVLDGAGLLDEYTNGTIWKSEKVNRKGKSREECLSQAKEKSAEYAARVLDKIADALLSKFGDSATDEVKKHLSEAKMNVLQDTSRQSQDWHAAMLNKNKGYTSNCDIRTLIDNFFAEFDALSGKKSAS